MGGGALNQPDSDAGSAGVNFNGRRKRLNSEGKTTKLERLTSITI